MRKKLLGVKGKGSEMCAEVGGGGSCRGALGERLVWWVKREEALKE